MWSKTYGDIIGVEITFSGQQTNDGGFILTGSKSNKLVEDVLLFKTDSNDDVRKCKAISSSSLLRFL